MRRWGLAAGLFIFAFASLLIASRTFNSISSPGLVDGRLADFRDAVYYPVRAVLDGHNPYDTPRYMALYPAVGQDFPPYTPAHLLVFMPVAAMSLELSRAVHFVLTLILFVCLSRLSLLWVGRSSWGATFGLAAIVVVSLPGRVILQTGQTTALTAVAVWAAWRFRDRPIVSGGLLALALFKPVIGLPVAAVFILARYAKPAFVALGLTAVLVVPVLLACVISAGGLRGFMDGIQRNLDYADSNALVLPRTGLSVDVASTFARVFDVDLSTAAWLLISVPVFVGVLYMLAKCRPMATGLDLMALAIPGVLLVGYQPGYHCILLVPVVVWVALGPGPGFRSRWLVVALLGWLFVTPFATNRFLAPLGDQDPRRFLAASLGTLCLAGAFVLLSRDLLARSRSGSAKVSTARQPVPDTRA